jgi:DNA-binding NtrC family response regulator
MNKIVVIDDNKNMQIILKNILADEGYQIQAAASGRDGLNLVKSVHPDLVLLDIRLPNMNGMQVLKKIKEFDPEILVIMITAFGDIKTAVEAMKLGAYDYVTKPFVNEELIMNIEKALQTSQLSREVRSLRSRLKDVQQKPHLSGESQQIKRVIKQINLISTTDMSVIIQGKSGTGKEIVAQMIHQKSSRREFPFVPIDCGAIPDTLVESELFGYEKGAFTGANSSKKGKFEAADKGTLFLDEITNMPASAQAKLLRVLQDRSINRIGSTKQIPVDVRIVVATNLNIIDVVNAGEFREDLFHRLNEFLISLPQLSERKEDITLLADEFLQDANNELGKHIMGISPEALKKMLSYHWPGNVRELKHLIKRAVLMEDQETISSENLQQQLSIIERNDDISNIDAYYQKIINGEISLADITSRITSKIEKEIINRLLLDVKFNKSKAARILDIDRNTLYNKMKSLDI